MSFLIFLLLLADSDLPQQGESPPYVLLEVATRPSWHPAINNRGEVVYVAYDDDGFPNIYSTTRGQLTQSKTGLLRFPHVNESGEVVYADRLDSEEGFQIWSISRGAVTQGHAANLPAISDSGEICFVRSVGDRLELFSNTRGSLVLFDGPWSTSCDISRGGEIVYRDRDELGQFQIYSSSRGQLTDASENHIGSPAINGAGEVAYVDQGEIYGVGKGQITHTGGKIGFRIDINDRGDIVFPINRRTSYKVALATRNPELYPQLDKLDMADAPDTARRLPAARRSPTERQPRAAGRSPADFPQDGLQVRVAMAPSPQVAQVEERRSLLPVVIFTTNTSHGDLVDFDAARVDELSVWLGPNKASIVVRSMAERRDVDGDGDVDIVLWFRLAQTGLHCRDSGASLFGYTTSGQPFTAIAHFGRPIC